MKDEVREDESSEVDPFSVWPVTHSPSPHVYPGKDGSYCAGATFSIRTELLQCLERSVAPQAIEKHVVELPGDEHGHAIFTLDNVFSNVECEAIIQYSEAKGFEEALVNVMGNQQRRMPELRNNFRTMIEDPELADKLWGRVDTFCPEYFGSYRRSGLNEQIRFLRYDQGQKFDAHFDGPHERLEGPRKGEKSFLTFQIYLTEKFEFGTTSFLDKDGVEIAAVKPRTGRVLVFEHNLLHRGAPPVGGRKYVVRTDVMYAPMS